MFSRIQSKEHLIPLRCSILIFLCVLFSSRSAAAVAVCKYIFGAFEDIEEAEAEGKIFEKESRAAQNAGAAPQAVAAKNEDETHP
jgi:hypothetical protein